MTSRMSWPGRNVFGDLVAATDTHDPVLDRHGPGTTVTHVVLSGAGNRVGGVLAGAVTRHPQPWLAFVLILVALLVLIGDRIHRSLRRGRRWGARGRRSRR